MSLRLTSVNLPEKSYALTNKIYSSRPDASALNPARKPNAYVDVKGFVFLLEACDKLKEGEIALNKVHREAARIGLNAEVIATPFTPPRNFELSYIKFVVDHTQRPANNAQQEIKGDALELVLKKQFSNHVFVTGSAFAVDFDSIYLKCTVAHVECLSLSEEPETPRKPMGFFNSQTEIDFMNGATLRVLTSKSQQRNLFQPDFNFNELGIGGLDKEFGDIFRRAFASRVFPPHIVRNLGINHVRGMLLYGPPGTGKTLMARQIGKMLKAAEPKIINGPEILNKYVGQSEENIRKLFEDAEKEYKELGENSQLHIIIFDELDCICKARGSSGGTGVQDGVVNQLLSKIDGVDALNNILLIGMTNRIDLIDEALMRPGRMEVHMEISLPSEDGRVDILHIHTKKMREHNYLKGVDLKKIAAETKNFSGAELEGLVRSATSFALNSKVNASNIGKKMEKLDDIEVTSECFDFAKTEILPQFGQKEKDIAPFLGHGIIHYSSQFDTLYAGLRSLVNQVRETEMPLLSIMLEGDPGAGKTAIAAHLAKESEYPFVRIISPNDFVGMGELNRINQISKVFEDAYKSKLSVIIVDNMERLFNYSPIGPRFDNMVMQGLMTVIRKVPPTTGRKLLIIATTSSKMFMDQAEVTQCFHKTIHVPYLQCTEDIRAILSKQNGFNKTEAQFCAESLGGNASIGIQQLITVAEMAVFMASSRQIRLQEAFIECNL